MIKKYSEKKTVFGGAVLWSSKIVEAGDFVFLSGLTAIDETGNLVSGGIKDQVRMTFDRVKDVLKQVGCDLGDIVKITVYLADARDFISMNDALVEIFPGDPPARTTVVAQPVIDTKIELDVIAYRRKG